MSTLFLRGAAEHNSDDELLLTDQLLGMGSAVTSEQGSLAWCEAFAISKALCAALNFVELMGNQLSPTNMSIFADRFATIYGIATQGNGIVPTNLNQIQTYVGLKEAVFGTSPSYSSVSQYIKAVLNQTFIDLEYIDPHLQSLATMEPLTDGYEWFSPLSTLLVRVWQPRDNQDNLLMSTPTFLSVSNSYKSFVQPWLPSDIAVRNLHLVYAGNDGYGSYAAAFNVISGSANTNTITGVGTTFIADLPNVPLGYDMPIEVVDDLNQLQTYHVISVNSNTSITVLENIVNNITSRTYRLLGIQMDRNYVLDDSCFNQ